MIPDPMILMKKYLILHLLIINLFLTVGYQNAEGCTIGVASGEATDGHPLLWKTRDCTTYVNNKISYDTGGIYNFIYVWDVNYGNELTWMGMNEKGFAIVNVNVTDSIPVRHGNGSLMFEALGICDTIGDFVALVNSLYLPDHDIHGIFGVIDRIGGAAMFEIGDSLYGRCDADSFIVRTDFFLCGTDIDSIPESESKKRYIRSMNLIGEFYADSNLNYQSILQDHMRDFSYSDSEPVDVPYPHQWIIDRPYGYINTRYSICRHISVSATVIRGVEPSELVRLTTMWTMLGQTAGSIAVPYWSVGNPPDDTDSLFNVTYQIKQCLFDYSNERYIDSYKLRNEDGNSLWDQIYPVGEIIFDSTDSFLENNPSESEMLIFEAEMARYAFSELQRAFDVIDTISIVADFTYILGGDSLTVRFRDRSLHNPIMWEWDFNNDGTIDTTVQNPEWTYDSCGTYIVSLTVKNSSGYSTKTDTITVEPTGIFNNKLSSILEIPSLSHNYPNPFNPETTIRYFLPYECNAELKIYNICGQLVRNLINEPQKPGYHKIVWYGRNNLGKTVLCGVYFLKFHAGEKTETKKLIKAK